MQGFKEPPMRGRLNWDLERKGTEKPGGTRQGTGKPGTEYGSEPRKGKVQNADIKGSK